MPWIRAPTPFIYRCTSGGRAHAWHWIFQAPNAKDFSYTFDHLADVTQHFTEAPGLRHYATM
jgi:hypothetical protein